MKTHFCGWTALDVPEWREMTEQTDWRAKQPSQVACFSEDLKCWGAHDTTCGHKGKAKDIRPSITWRRETREKEVQDVLLKRTREEHHQSDKHWNCFKGNTGETSQRRGGTHILYINIGFSEHIDIPSWTELKWTSHYFLPIMDRNFVLTISSWKSWQFSTRLYSLTQAAKLKRLRWFSMPSLLATVTPFCLRWWAVKSLPAMMLSSITISSSGNCQNSTHFIHIIYICIYQCYQNNEFLKKTKLYIILNSNATSQEILFLS